MTIRQQVTELLAVMPSSSILINIYEGRDVPPLSDLFYLHPVPEDWTSPPPASVNGLALLPAFTHGGSFSIPIYCIEVETGRFFAIDPEEPWPPAEVFASCHDFLLHILRLVAENGREAETNQFRELLRRNGVPAPAE